LIIWLAETRNGCSQKQFTAFFYRTGSSRSNLRGEKKLKKTFGKFNRTKSDHVRKCWAEDFLNIDPNFKTEEAIYERDDFTENKQRESV
jgi:hypothetical protein